MSADEHKDPTHGTDQTSSTDEMDAASSRRGRARQRHERRRRGGHQPSSFPEETGASPDGAHSEDENQRSRPNLLAQFGGLRNRLPLVRGGNETGEGGDAEHQTSSAGGQSSRHDRDRKTASPAAPASSLSAALSPDGEIDFLKLVPPRVDNWALDDDVSSPASHTAASTASESAAPSTDSTATDAPDTLDARRVRARERRQQAGMAMRNAVHARPQAARPQAATDPRASLSKLRRMDFTQLRGIAAVLAAAGVMIAVIVGLALFKDEPLAETPNAIWLGSEWTHETRPADQMARLVGRLQENNIGTVYARVSWLRDDLTWAGHAEQNDGFDAVRESVQRFTVQLKTMYPDVTLYGWVDFPVNRGPQGYRLNDAAAQAAVADFSLVIVTELGFDGVFLNVSPVLEPNADDFVGLLQRVKLRMGDNGPVAVAVPPDYTPTAENIPQSPLYAPGTAWTKQFKQRVALLTDEIALTPYSTGLNDRAAYEDWLAYQVEAYARAVAELDSSAQIMVGIPTYDSDPPLQNASVENVSAALSGVEKGIALAGRASQYVKGVALFAEWTTDDSEWRLFNQLWIN